jgi:group II intron reverse transcriptase/maturase
MAKSVRELQKVLGQAAKDDPRRRFHSLYDKVSSMRVLEEAWHVVMKNGGRGGVDGKEFTDYENEETVEELLKELENELIKGIYKPDAVLRVYIPKPDGKERPLGIPTIRDRVVQAAAKLILEPIFEADFKDFSYGFREGKSSHQAMQAVWKWMNFGYTEVIDADIQGFFDNIPHDKLLQSVARRVSDGRMMRLIKLFLKAPIREDDNERKPKKGTPQGGVISPLLANIYLNHLDQFWTKKGYIKYAKLVRYADDFVVLCEKNTKFYLGEVKRLIENLGLTLNEKKTHVVDTCHQGFDFLGFTLRRAWAYRPKQNSFGWVTGVSISRKALKKARKTVNQIVGQGGRKSPVPMINLVEGLNRWIIHWLPYYSYANRKEDFNYLYEKIVLERLVRAEVARRTGNKRQSRKWKSMNPKIWEQKYGLIDVVATYYQRRKHLYASLFEHPINAVA